MPELPEVETMVRGVEPLVAGSVIEELRSLPCRCKPLDSRPGLPAMARQLRGQHLVRMFRRAKRIVFEVAPPSAQDEGSPSRRLLVIEPRMTGLLLLTDPPDREHLRIEWRLITSAGPRSLWYWDRRGLGTVRLYSAAQFVKELGPQRLGPDALEMTLTGWREALERTRRAIKVVLLDQQVVAGIGNLYASEILHVARIHPQTPACHLTAPAIRRLNEAVQSVLREAIEYEGSTLGDGTYRNALNRPGRYQNIHRVYARGGELCPTCRRQQIVRIVQSQRSTFLCPYCQRSA